MVLVLKISLCNLRKNHSLIEQERMTGYITICGFGPGLILVWIPYCKDIF